MNQTSIDRGRVVPAEPHGPTELGPPTLQNVDEADTVERGRPHVIARVGSTGAATEASYSMAGRRQKALPMRSARRALRLFMPLRIPLPAPPKWSTGSVREASHASPPAPANPLALDTTPT